MCEADIAVNLAFILGVLFSSIVRWRSGGIPRKESAPAVIQDALSATVFAIKNASRFRETLVPFKVQENTKVHRKLIVLVCPGIRS